MKEQEQPKKEQNTAGKVLDSYKMGIVRRIIKRINRNIRLMYYREFDEFTIDLIRENFILHNHMYELTQHDYFTQGLKDFLIQLDKDEPGALPESYDQKQLNLKLF